MSDQLARRIDDILFKMEQGEWTAEQCLMETRQEQPVLHAYLFSEENEFLTPDENQQLLLLHAIIWPLRKTDQPIAPSAIEELEDAIWAEAERKEFPFDATNPKIEALHDDIFAIIIDCADRDLHAITAIGAQWLIIKGLVLAILLTRESA